MSHVIAIDGPAASGKSTIAGKVAARLGIAYVSTGSLYRAIALAAREANRPYEMLDSSFLGTLRFTYQRNPSGEYELQLNDVFPGEALRAADIAAGASTVATLPVVREYLLDVQRGFATGELIVMEGRDIGTVIFPDADYKFFVTASPEERARRRLAQGGETPDGATLAQVAREIAARDKQDSERVIAPLKPASDAVIIDSTGLQADDVVARILAIVQNGEAGHEA